MSEIRVWLVLVATLNIDGWRKSLGALNVSSRRTPKSTSPVILEDPSKMHALPSTKAYPLMDARASPSAEAAFVISSE